MTRETACSEITAVYRGMSLARALRCCRFLGCEPRTAASARLLKAIAGFARGAIYIAGRARALAPTRAPLHPCLRVRVARTYANLQRYAKRAPRDLWVDKAPEGSYRGLPRTYLFHFLIKLIQPGPILVL